MSELRAGVRVLVDCRWLGLGGAGRATEFLLRGLKQIEPAGTWILWGPDAVRDYAWPRAQLASSTLSPHWIPSQLGVLSMPRHDVALYMHQVRPLRPGRAVTLIHDTMQLRFGGSWPRRLTKRISHYVLARLTTSVITVSEFSKQTIRRDLPLGSKSVRVVHYPIDPEFIARVEALRASSQPRNRALYVGQYAPHKNLARLIQAFTRSRFAAEGGQLQLVGGSARWQDTLRRVAGGAANVHIEGSVSQSRVEELYATSRLLVIPSLEEGFGLPAWEALSIGLPVCASTAGALPEVTAGRAVLCDPLSVADIARGIDEASARPRGAGIAGPSMTDYAQTFIDALVDVTSRSRSLHAPGLSH